jgi:hypothetical protein
MRAVDLFREFQDARLVAGQFAFFTILFFLPQVGGVHHLVDGLDGTIQMDLLNAAEEKNWQPLAILGVPSLEGLRNGQEAYIKRFRDDDWASGYIKSALRNCISLIELNPPKV